MQNCGIGWQNRVLDAALTASAQLTGLPAANLRNQHGAASLGWRAQGTSASITLKLSSVSSWRAFGFFRTNLSATAVLSVAVMSGSNTVWTGDALGGAKNGQILLVSGADVLGDNVTLTLSDPANPDGFIAAALAYAGPLWQPERNYSTSSTRDRVLGQDTVTALSGTEFVESRWLQRKLTIAHQSYGDADALVLEKLLNTAATGQNMLFIPQPDNQPTAPADVALFGQLSGSDLSNPFGIADRHSLTLTFMERL